MRRALSRADQLPYSCNDGCQYGVLHCEQLANASHAACAADPRQGCDAIRAGAASRCAATVTVQQGGVPVTMSAYAAYCNYSRYYDVFCYQSIQMFWENACVADTDASFAQCRGAD